MTPITTLTFSPSLDSATVTDKIYPEGKLRCEPPVFEPGGGGINVARAIRMLGGQALALFPAGGPTGRPLLGELPAHVHEARELLDAGAAPGGPVVDDQHAPPARIDQAAQALHADLLDAFGQQKGRG